MTVMHFWPVNSVCESYIRNSVNSYRIGFGALPHCSIPLSVFFFFFFFFWVAISKVQMVKGNVHVVQPDLTCDDYLCTLALRSQRRRRSLNLPQTSNLLGVCFGHDFEGTTFELLRRPFSTRYRRSFASLWNPECLRRSCPFH